MKEKLVIASIAPAFWVCVAISMVGTPPAHHDPGEVLSGGIVITAAFMVVPCAIIAFLCGKHSKDE